MSSNKTAVAKHRQKINADPIARAQLLAKRRESYQRRKQAALGANPDHPPIRNLSDAEAQKKRKQWRGNQRKHRVAEKCVRAVLDITPESFEEPPCEALARLHPAAPIPRPQSPPTEPIPPPQSPPTEPVPLPLASSTPEQARKTQRSQDRLKKQNESLKRELFQLKKHLARSQKRSEHLRKDLQREKKKVQPKKKKFKKISLKRSVSRREKVSGFLSRDENSRQLAGRKDTITKNKVKLQRRILSNTLKELHCVYNSEVAKEDSMSYRQFLRLRPFHITEPKASDRDTCACIHHENMGLLVEKLKLKGLLKTSSISQLVAAIVCDAKIKKCMYRLCPKCCYNDIQVVLPEEPQEIVWEQWEREKTQDGGKQTTHFAKKKKSGTWSELVKVFNSKLDALATHQYNWIHQAEQCRHLKETLSEEEVVVHMDFSENYACKLATEIQAFHFGGSRKQATIHTIVAYTSGSHQSYATISDSLRHDERSVWAHLKPVLEDLKKENPTITTLHCMSDGPVTQYRNRRNFYLMSTVPILLGFKKLTWNFSEKCHGKGAPDGVGGAIKRLADDHVKKGGDIQKPEDLYQLLQSTASNIRHFWVSETDVSRYDEAVPDNLPPVKGTFKIHQIESTEPGKIHHREVSCFCSRQKSPCECGPSVEIQFHNEIENYSPDIEDAEDLTGKFVVVMYDSKPFVGQVVQVVGNEMEVNCMHQSAVGKNAFAWPKTADKVFYFRPDIKAIVSEPEPLTMRQSKLISADWVKFSV